MNYVFQYNLYSTDVIRGVLDKTCDLFANDPGSNPEKEIFLFKNNKLLALKGFIIFGR